MCKYYVNVVGRKEYFVIKLIKKIIKNLKMDIFVKEIGVVCEGYLYIEMIYNNQLVNEINKIKYCNFVKVDHLIFSEY